MKTKYTLFRRSDVFYIQDSAIGKRTSLRTKDETWVRSLPCADAPGFAVAAQAAAGAGARPPCLQRAQAFLQAFLERAADGHGFAPLYICVVSVGSACGMVAVRQHLEGKARNSGDDVIDARLEARGGFARDVVLEFVEQVADGEFGAGNHGETIR